MTALIIAFFVFIAFLFIVALIFLIISVNLYKTMIRESVKYHQAKFNAMAGKE